MISGCLAAILFFLIVCVMLLGLYVRVRIRDRRKDRKEKEVYVVQVQSTLLFPEISPGISKAWGKSGGKCFCGERGTHCWQGSDPAPSFYCRDHWRQFIERTEGLVTVRRDPPDSGEPLSEIEIRRTGGGNITWQIIKPQQGAKWQIRGPALAGTSIQ